MNLEDRKIFLKLSLQLNECKTAAYQAGKLMEYGNSLEDILAKDSSLKFNCLSRAELENLQAKHNCLQLNYSLAMQLTELLTLDQYVRTEAPHLQSYQDSINLKTVLSLQPLPSQHNVGTRISQVLFPLMHQGRMGDKQAELVHNYLLKLVNNQSITINTYTFMLDYYRTWDELPVNYHLVFVKDQQTVFNQLPENEKERINSNRKKLGMLPYEKELEFDKIKW